MFCLTCPSTSPRFLQRPFYFSQSSSKRPRNPDYFYPNMLQSKSSPGINKEKPGSFLLISFSFRKRSSSVRSLQSKKSVREKSSKENENVKKEQNAASVIQKQWRERKKYQEDVSLPLH